MARVRSTRLQDNPLDCGKDARTPGNRHTPCAHCEIASVRPSGLLTSRFRPAKHAP